MASTPPVSVCLVEDEPNIREMLSSLFIAEPSIQLLGVFATGEAAVKEIPSLVPQVVMMDIGLPGITGIECVRQLAPNMPHTQFMMYTMHDDDGRVFDALRAGANGYILKSSSVERIISSIHELKAEGAPMSASVARRVIAFHREREREAVNGVETLSPREQNVLELLAQGLLYKEIAERLHLTTNTVGQHVYRIYRKLHVNNRMEAVNKYLGR